MPKAYVIFAGPKRRIPFRTLRRLVKRRPALAPRLLATWLTQALSGSNVTHVAIGDGVVVLEPALDGDRYYAFRDYVLTNATLIDLVTVNVARSIDLASRRPRVGRPVAAIVRSLAHWITRGLTPADNCLTITVGLLRDGGCPVPDTILTPIQLRNWLVSQGYHHVTLS